MTQKKWLSSFVFALGIIAVDILSKRWALFFCKTPQRYTDFLSCELSFNRGISCGLFNSHNTIPFTVITGCIICVILSLVYYTYKRFRDHKNIRGEICVLSGALANIIDRFYYRAVIDFIVIEYHGWLIPTFNIADLAITSGVMLLLWQDYTTSRPINNNTWFHRITTCGPIGYCKAPGTMASLAILPMIYLLHSYSSNLLFHVTLIILLSALSVYFINKSLPIIKSDPQYIVIDECIGLLCAFLGNAGTVSSILLTFVIFRILDIVKPSPIRQAEHLPGAWGILADDIAAGIITALFMYCLYSFP
jgi:phosphatidylglycerophosphatase A